jgi:phage tail sheath protein FI
MVTVSYPGVYVQEIPSGVVSISGVSTSIAAFIGMAKRGPMLRPTRVLGFKDYERIFSDDTSQGEMTEQVRQFFINGGEQAYIVRVADSAQEASVPLANEAGDTVLTLTSRDAGLDANQIRVRIDYNTASPERTFNLELFREVFDASGQPQVSASERHNDVSIDPNASRYVITVLDQQSQLATAVANEANVTAAATLPAYSASAGIFADANAAEAALSAAIAATADGTIGRFRIKVGTAPWITVEVAAAGLTLAGVENAINAGLVSHTTVTVNIPAPADSPLRIVASTALSDVLVEPAAQLDIAQPLGLGTAQGGIEVGSHAAARPVPSGLVSKIDDGPGDLAALLSFGAIGKASLDDIGVAGPAAVRPFTIQTAEVTYPDAAGLLNAGTASSAPSLRNIRENLQAIATALSAASADWRAEVQGHRLALIADFGGTSSGANATFTSSGTDLSDPGEIYDGISGRRVAEALGGGGDGAFAKLGDYEDAFQIIDEDVDLFNIMLLPGSAADTGSPSERSSVWGPASSFCQRKRAFLIVDVEPAQQTPQGVLDSLQALRTGVVKDHAAFWWPEVTITSNGTSKNIDPSGSIAGLMSRIDGTRGVWKAPAGLEASLLGVRGVRVPMSDAQNGLLNPQAANAIRSFPNGVTSWGARTMDGFDNSGNSDYRYVPVRRFALFIEESLLRGLRFAVFEPNDEPLWAQIRLAAGAFMNGLFRKGAFAGATASDAYFIKCDAETTTPTDQNLGVVNVLVGFAPLKPAEFIVISLQQKAGQAQV